MERLNYNRTRKLPEYFSENEIGEILKEIDKSEKYWKGLPNSYFKKGHKISEWGVFFKARDKTILATIYILGLRPKEACCLKFSDFDMRKCLVKIRGENNKVRKDRVIPVPQVLISIYRNYLKFPRCRFWKGSKYLFPSFMKRYISPKSVERMLREKALKPLGLWTFPEKHGSQRTTYKLRHSRATHILAKQIKEDGKPDIFAIANFLGHSDISSTLVYLHTDKSYQEYLRKQIEI